MRVLVTGATGFLGSWLCRRLAREGHSVTAFRRAESDIAPIADLRLMHAIGDVTDFESVDRAIAGHDAVVHAAASLRWLSSRAAREEQFRVNVWGTGNVASACRQRRVARLVHVSSMSAIGVPPDPDHPADESFEYNLAGVDFPYHASKREAEEVVAREVSAGLDAVIVNPTAVWGPFGARYRGVELFEKVRRRKVVLYYRGGINVAHVEDVADGIARAIGKGRAGERYILGGENLTIERIARTAAEVLEVSPRLVRIPAPVTWLASTLLAPVERAAGRRPRVTREIHYFSGHCQYYDSGKAQRELGYTARPFRDVARECAAFVSLRAVTA